MRRDADEGDGSVWLARGRARSVRREPETGLVVKRFRHPSVLYRWLDGRRARAEYRCLVRMHAAGARVPRPLEVRARDGGWEVRMEEIPGAVPLGELISEGRAPEGGWHRLLARLGRALARLHEADIVHPDLKPGNVLVDAGGAPWLVDFHAARAGHELSPARLFRDVVVACAAGRETLPPRPRLRFLVGWMRGLAPARRRAVVQLFGDGAGLAQELEREGRVLRRARVAHGAGRWLRESSRARVSRTGGRVLCERRRLPALAAAERAHPMMIEGPADELRRRWLAAARLLEHGIPAARPVRLELEGRTGRATFELPIAPTDPPSSSRPGGAADAVGELLGTLHDRGLAVPGAGPALVAIGDAGEVALRPPPALASFDPLHATAGERFAGFEDLAGGQAAEPFREGYLRALAGRDGGAARAALRNQSRSPASLA